MAHIVHADWPAKYPKGTEKTLLEALVVAITEGVGFHCVDDVDGVGLFGIGHSDEPADNVGKPYIVLDFRALSDLSSRGFVENIEIDPRRPFTCEHDESGMHVTRKALKAFFIGNEFAGFDPELISRCEVLVLQGHWDTAIREAMLVFETRLRQVSGSSKYGVDLVNECMSDKGPFIGKFEDDKQRQRFRDLFAGVMGVIRNDYAHNFRNPGRHETWTILRLTNLLLQKIDELK